MSQSVDKPEIIIDWSAPTNITTDELELKWSDDEEEFDEQGNKVNGNIIKDSITNNPITNGEEKIIKESSIRNIDFIAQHLKFIAILRIMMDEMATLASGFEIDGGQLRFELFKWLERECAILHEICDFRFETKQFNLSDEEEYFDDSLKEEDR